MNLIKKFLAMIIIVTSLFCGSVIEAWDNERTHPDLSEIAARQSKLTKQDYLKQIGLSRGLDERINGKEIFVWLREGAFLEDAGTYWQMVTRKARFFNHFHNPLKPWNHAGLNDVIVISNPLLPISPISSYFIGESALLWAQDEGAQARYLEIDDLGGDQTWPRVRQFYYEALTRKTDTDRQANFAKTFRGLGYQMHLLQDMAVPAHVRNDAHPEESIFEKIRGDYYFEIWAKTHVGDIQRFAAAPDYPEMNFTDGQFLMAQFYDANKYVEGVIPSTAKTWGLSEYTNANFMSADTIFTDSYSKDDGHYFPYPKYDPDCYGLEKVSDTILARYYVSRSCNGAPMAYLASSGVSSKYLNTLMFDWGLQRAALKLDETTNKAYAEKLVPRAVGYSAALLNYFFRGDIKLSYDVTSTAPGYILGNNTGEKLEGYFTVFYDNRNDQRYPLWVGNGYLEATKGDKTNTFDFIPPADPKEPGRYIVAFKGKMGNEEGAVAGYVFSRTLEITPPAQFVYSIVRNEGDNPQFREIKAKIRNPNTSETMKSGVVYGIVKYKINTADAEFKYSVSGSKPADLSNKDGVEVTFEFSSPIPLNISDLYLQVVFKGVIADETDAIAVGVKDISEPTPIDLFNDTDRVCINASWYVAGTDEAKQAVGTNYDGTLKSDYFAHNIKNTYIKFSSDASRKQATPGDYHINIETINPGQHARPAYILTDYQYYYSIIGEWHPIEGSPDFYYHYPGSYGYTGTGLKNQSDLFSDQDVCGTDRGCTLIYSPEYYNYRGVDLWARGSFIYLNHPYPENSVCN